MAPAPSCIAVSKTLHFFPVFPCSFSTIFCPPPRSGSLLNHKLHNFFLHFVFLLSIFYLDVFGEI